jgi:cytochrome P450
MLLHRMQVVSQLNTFLVAAFETTTSAIAFCIYFIAQHPQVQAALLAEVDAFGRSRQVTFNDLDKVRTLDLIWCGFAANRATVWRSVGCIWSCCCGGGCMSCKSNAHVLILL